MSEPKGRFDAAISILNLTHFRTDIHPNVQKIIDVAIRVLEAAGKVDKVHCLDKLDFLRRMAGEDRAGFVRYREDGLAIFPTAQIRALLEALPGKEKL